MKTCRDILENLVPLALGELDGAERTAAESHLAACEACRAEAALMKGALDAVRDDREEAPAGYAEHLERRLRTRLRARKTVSMPWSFAAAAALVAALALALYAPAPEISPEFVFAEKARALSAEERASVLEGFFDAEGWRADDLSLAALHASLPLDGEEDTALPNGGVLDKFSDDELNLLYEAVSLESERT